MQIVGYESFHRSGIGGELCRISAADLLRAYPYLLVGGSIPPLAVANDVLRQGEFDAGMGGAGKWEPMVLTEAEYSEVVEDLLDNGLFGRILAVEETPDWVTSLEEWSLWVSERAYGIPLEENRRLKTAMAEIHALMNEAEERGDEEERVTQLLRSSEIWKQYCDLVRRHRGE